MTYDHGLALLSLRRRWLTTAGLGVAALVAGAALLLPALDRDAVIRWLLVAAGVLGYQLAFVGRRLSLNHPEGEDGLLPGFGPGNTLTLLRGVLLALLAGFLVVPWPRGPLAWAPAVLYMAADVADYFDGYLARVSRHATLLGQAIDMEFDALGLLVGVGVAIHLGQLPTGFLPFGLARYAFVLGVGILERCGRTTHPLPESVSRRPIAGLTMAFVSAALWPVVIPPAATLAGILFAIPFAASFGRDGLVVSGILDPDSDVYRIGRRRLKRLLLNLLPPVLRALLAVALALLTARMLQSPPVWAPAPQALFVGLQVLAGVCIAAGFVGRLAAVGLIVPLGLGAHAEGLSPLRGWAFGLAIAILILGTGAASLWKPEETRLRRRAGERDD
ncbi:MAG: CDP-alcohol phosphatidyltransferase family protein [Anaerolineales bacterium]|nr:CDP-alcohol phosphatidyltransferase family protein [Anaerolineales bacterium]